MGDICVFGASITWGAWDYEKGGWVNRLRLYLDESDNDSFVYNLSVPGNTTTDLLERCEAEIKVREPKLIIFSIGGVDSMFEGNSKIPVTPIDDFEDNILNLITIANKYTSRVIIIGLPAIDERFTKRGDFEEGIHYTKDSVELYDETLRSISQKKRVEYIDIFNLLDPKDVVEGLYPNAQGHQKIFEIVRDRLKRLQYIQ